MPYLSVDPGKHDCGLALWDDTGGLVRAGFVQTPHGGTQRVAIWTGTANAVLAWLRNCKPDLILEIPQVYGGPRSNDPNDLLDLAGVQGAVAALVGGTVLWSPLPREWKGQLPKAVSQARVNAALSDAEKARILWPTASLRHNVFDALHLGIVYLQRHRVRVRS